MLENRIGRLEAAPPKASRRVAGNEGVGGLLEALAQTRRGSIGPCPPPAACADRPGLQAPPRAPRAAIGIGGAGGCGGGVARAEDEARATRDRGESKARSCQHDTEAGAGEMVVGGRGLSPARPLVRFRAQPSWLAPWTCMAWSEKRGRVSRGCEGGSRCCPGRAGGGSLASASSVDSESTVPSRTACPARRILDAPAAACCQWAVSDWLPAGGQEELRGRPVPFLEKVFGIQRCAAAPDPCTAHGCGACGCRESGAESGALPP